MPRWDTNLQNDDETYRTGGTTPTIRYANRTVTGDVHKAAVPGALYVSVNMSRSSDGRFLVPYTLKVKITGTAGQGRPEYVAPPTPSPSPTPENSTTPTADASPQPVDLPGRGVPPEIVIVIGLCAGALGVGGALAIARIRRRRRTEP